MGQSGEELLAYFAAFIMIIAIIYLIYDRILSKYAEKCPQCATNNFRAKALKREVLSKKRLSETQIRKLTDRDKDGNVIGTREHPVAVNYIEEMVRYDMKCKKCGFHWSVSGSERS